MAVDIRVEGVGELEKLGRQLREVGDKELRRELYKGVNRATKQLKADVKQEAAVSLPRRGGLAKLIASSRLSTSTRTTGRDPGVRITGRLSGHDLQAIDRGRLRHPVFGNRSRWVTQQIRPGFFTRPLQDGSGPVRDELLNVFDDIARRLRG